MTVHVGSGNNPAKIYVGTTPVRQVYRGTTLVWSDAAIPPVTPPPVSGGTLTPTVLQDRVTKDEITFFFDQPRPVGQYVNGDYFVQSPVKIIGTNPAGVRTGGHELNGMELNPRSGPQGFDSRRPPNNRLVYEYNSARNIDPGITAKSVDFAVGQEGSLVKMTSYPLSSQKGSGYSWLERAAVLTVVKNIPRRDSFRPAPRGTNKESLHTFNDLDFSVLRKLPPIEGLRSFDDRVFCVKPLFVTWSSFGDAVLSAIRPGKHYPCGGYQPEVGETFQSVAMLLHSNYTNEQKRELYIHTVQVGIDIVYSLLAHKPATTNAYSTSLLVPAAFAAIGLNSPEMKNMFKNNGMGQRDTFFYFEQHMVDRPIDQWPASSAWRNVKLPIQQGHVGLPTKSHVAGDNGNVSHAYMYYNSAIFVGNLAIMLLPGGEELLDAPIRIDLGDRHAHLMKPGEPWSFDDSNWANALTHRGNNPSFPRWYHAYRGEAPRPWWRGRPEITFPPRVTAQPTGDIEVVFNAFQCSNGLPITRRDLRYSTDQINWTIVEGVNETHVLTGLAGNTRYYIQTRIINTNNAGAWSTNYGERTRSMNELRATVVTANVQTKPNLQVAPTLSGQEFVGSILRVAAGDWAANPAPVISYQWQRSSGSSFVDIPGQTATSYMLTVTDLDSSIRCQLTAQNSVGSTIVYTPNAGPIANIPTTTVTLIRSADYPTYPTPATNSYFANVVSAPGQYIVCIDAQPNVGNDTGLINVVINGVAGTVLSKRRVGRTGNQIFHEVWAFDIINPGTGTMVINYLFARNFTQLSYTLYKLEGFNIAAAKSVSITQGNTGLDQYVATQVVSTKFSALIAFAAHNAAGGNIDWSGNLVVDHSRAVSGGQLSSAQGMNVSTGEITVQAKFNQTGLTERKFLTFVVVPPL